MNRYYHATTLDAFSSIKKDGLIRRSNIDGIVYVCEAAEDAYKFISLRAMFDPDITVVILPVDIPENIIVEETFDHSYQFFRCRSYGVPVDIPLDWIDVDNILIPV